VGSMVCYFLLFSAFAFAVLEFVQAGVNFNHVGNAALIIVTAIVIAQIPNIRLRVGRLLRPLLFAVGVMLLVLFIVAVTQNPEFRQLVEQAANAVASLFKDILSLTPPLPAVFAILSLIAFGVLCARHPATPS
jgi:hypothetical protein